MEGIEGCGGVGAVEGYGGDRRVGRGIRWDGRDRKRDGDRSVGGHGGVGGYGAHVTYRPQRPLMSPWEPQCPLLSLWKSQCHLLGTPTSPHDPVVTPISPPILGDPPCPLRPRGLSHPPPPPRDAVPPTISHHQLYWAPKKGGMRKINPKEALCGRAAVTVTGGGVARGDTHRDTAPGGSGGVPKDGSAHRLQLSHQGAQRHWGGTGGTVRDGGHRGGSGGRGDTAGGGE